MDRERIAVVRVLPGVGDLLCAVPALQAIRAARPTARITLVGHPTAGWFVDLYPRLLDDLLSVQGMVGFSEIEPEPTSALQFFGNAQLRRFDLALQLHGSGEVSNVLTTMLAARQQVTAHLPGRWVPPGISIPYPEGANEIARMLAVVAAAGCPPGSWALQLPVSADDRRTAQRLLGGPDTAPTTYACVHVGGSNGQNGWTTAGFATVADDLTLRGYTVVLTGGRNDHDRVQATMRAMAAPGLNLAGRTSLTVLGAVYSSASLVVTDDTGASHVAAAVRTPSVVITGSSEPERWAPLDGGRHVLVTGARPPAWPDLDAVLVAVDQQLQHWPLSWSPTAPVAPPTRGIAPAPAPPSDALGDGHDH